MRNLFAVVALCAVLIAAGYALYVRGVVRLNYPGSARFPVRGIDVSHHQGRIDWPAVRTAGVDFVFIKASEGADHRDREFARNWESAQRVGIARGAYHFFTFCTPGLSQAENFASALGGAVGELPPVADVEFSGNRLLAKESVASDPYEPLATYARQEWLVERNRRPLARAIKRAFATHAA